MSYRKSKKLKSLCKDYFQEKDNLVFTGIKRNIAGSDIPIFSSIKEVKNLYGKIDCVFITANNESHLDIFKECLGNGINYIYIEKPAIGIQKYFESNLKSKFQDIKYLQVGYHMNYCKPFNILNNIIQKKIYGELIRLDLFLGHGLAFKNSFKDSWRAKEKFALTETVTSHLINLVFKLVDSQKLDDFQNLNYISKLNEKNKIKDTDHLSFTNKIGSFFNISASWGSPLESSLKLYFSNAIWEYDFKKIVIKEPRDNFDKTGNFIEPEKKIINMEFENIKSSLFYFLDKVKKNVSIKPEFNNSYLTELFMEKIKSFDNLN